MENENKVSKLEAILQECIDKYHPADQPYYQSGTFDGYDYPIFDAMIEFGRICWNDRLQDIKDQDYTDYDEWCKLNGYGN